MTDILSDNTKKAVPKNLSECVAPDAVSKRIWRWCKIIEIVGKILFWIFVFYGLIQAINTAERIEAITPKYEFNHYIFPILRTTAIYAFIEYFTYHLISLLLGILATFVQNNNISTNLKLFKMHKEISDSNNTSTEEI